MVKSEIIRVIQNYYENYPAITSVMQNFDVFRYDPELCEKVKEILEGQTAMIKDLIEGAQNEGDISSDADSADLASIILGFCREICLKWRISGQKFSLSKKTLSILEMTLKAFKGKKG
jgi:hypothetical protein